MTLAKFTPDAVVLDTKSFRGEKHLLVWRWARDGDFGKLWHAANAAVNQAAAYFLTRESVNADADLSDAGKRSRLEAAATLHLAEIGRLQKSLSEAGETIAAQGRELAAVKPYGAGSEAAATAIVDAEIARTLRELPESQREKIARSLLSGEHQRVVDAVLRLPPLVSGLSENVTGMIRAAAIRREHPGQVAKMEQLGEALAGAQIVVRKSAAAVIDSSGLDLPKQLESLQGSWKGIIPGREDALTALSNKYAAQQMARQ